MSQTRLKGYVHTANYYNLNLKKATVIVRRNLLLTLVFPYRLLTDCKIGMFGNTVKPCYDLNLYLTSITLYVNINTVKFVV